jgi:regulator of PEP synthase PpsR (kinase-PPPase family)
LRRADALYRANGIPVINSTTRSVEEMSTLILQTLGSRPSLERSRT